jgi:hypothetical protein
VAKGVPETHPEERGSLNWSPKRNWVDKASGLPSYIESVAVALVRGGMPRERAIPAAVSVIKKTCATGLWGGRPNAKVSPAIRGAACKAAAEWEAKKGGAKLAACVDCSKRVDLAFNPGEPRDAHGRWLKFLGAIKSLKPGESRVLAGGTAVSRKHDGNGFVVRSSTRRVEAAGVHEAAGHAMTLTALGGMSGTTPPAKPRRATRPSTMPKRAKPLASKSSISKLSPRARKLVEQYRIMHGKAPPASQVAKLAKNYPLSAVALGVIDLAGPVATSKSGGAVTTNALLKPATALKPRHLKLLARANANLAKAGMPKAKRKRVMRAMVKRMKAGNMSLSHPVDLAFNPSEMRAPKGAAGGGRWAKGGATKAQQKQPPLPTVPPKRQPPDGLSRKQKAAWRRQQTAIRKAARQRLAAAKRRIRNRNAQHKALALVNQQRRKYRGLQSNPHMRALALRSKTASNSKARVQAARALAKIIRLHGSARSRARRQAAAAQRKQARQTAASLRARASAARKPPKAKVPKPVKAPTPRVKAPKAAKPVRSKIGSGVPKRTATPRRLVSKL